MKKYAVKFRNSHRKIIITHLKMLFLKWLSLVKSVNIFNIKQALNQHIKKNYCLSFSTIYITVLIVSQKHFSIKGQIFKKQINKDNSNMFKRS